MNDLSNHLMMMADSGDIRGADCDVLREAANKLSIADENIKHMSDSIRVLQDKCEKIYSMAKIQNGPEYKCFISKFHQDFLNDVIELGVYLDFIKR